MLNVPEAIQKATKIFEEAGYRVSESDDYVSAKKERSFTIGVDVYISMRPVWVKPKQIRHNDPTKYYIVEPKVQISWAGTGRSVASATASLALYQEAVNLAALVEAIYQDEGIGTPVEETDQ